MIAQVLAQEVAQGKQQGCEQASRVHHHSQLHKHPDGTQRDLVYLTDTQDMTQLDCQLKRHEGHRLSDMSDEMAQLEDQRLQPQQPIESHATL